MKTLNSLVIAATLTFGTVTAQAAEPVAELATAVTTVVSAQLVEVSANMRLQISNSIEKAAVELMNVEATTATKVAEKDQQKQPKA